MSEAEVKEEAIQEEEVDIDALETRLKMAEKILHSIQESLSKNPESNDPSVMYIWGQVDAYFSMVDD